jgi:osmotically-inducible protein OsmY
MPPPETPRPAKEETKHGAIGHLSAAEQLQQTVCAALIEDQELDSSDIGVRVTNDTVMLSGSVKNREAWQRAIAVAKAQRGVTNVQGDELSVSARSAKG